MLYNNNNKKILKKLYRKSLSSSFSVSASSKVSSCSLSSCDLVEQESILQNLPTTHVLVLLVHFHVHLQYYHCLCVPGIQNDEEDQRDYNLSFHKMAAEYKNAKYTKIFLCYVQSQILQAMQVSQPLIGIELLYRAGGIIHIHFIIPLIILFVNCKSFCNLQTLFNKRIRVSKLKFHNDFRNINLVFVFH